MLVLYKRRAGFTIVELLIVVIVIAILAAISVVAFTGIQNRANDTAVQNDLNNFAKKIQVAAADTGIFPSAGALRSVEGGTVTGDSTIFSGMNFKFAASSYSTTGTNVGYCSGPSVGGGGSVFRVQSRSKSTKLYEYSSTDGMREITPVVISESVSLCDGIGYPRRWAYGYASNDWKSWAE